MPPRCCWMSSGLSRDMRLGLPGRRSGVTKRLQRRVVQRHPVSPERPPGGEQALTQRPGELVERAPAGDLDLLEVTRLDGRVLRRRVEDVRAPRQLQRPVAEE